MVYCILMHLNKNIINLNFNTSAAIVHSCGTNGIKILVILYQ